MNHLELRSDVLNKTDAREVEANRYAGELLIPKESLLRIYKMLILPSLPTLSEIFDVLTGVMRGKTRGSWIKLF